MYEGVNNINNDTHLSELVSCSQSLHQKVSAIVGIKSCTYVDMLENALFVHEFGYMFELTDTG